jgi:hypothetical protein
LEATNGAQTEEDHKEEEKQDEEEEDKTQKEKKSQRKYPRQFNLEGVKLLAEWVVRKETRCRAVSSSTVSVTSDSS